MQEPDVLVFSPPDMQLPSADLQFRAERLIRHYIQSLSDIYTGLGAVQPNSSVTGKIMLCYEHLQHVANLHHEDDLLIRNAVNSHAWALLAGQAAMEKLPAKSDLAPAVSLYSKALGFTVKPGSITDGWLLLRLYTLPILAMRVADSNFKGVLSQVGLLLNRKIQ